MVRLGFDSPRAFMEATEELFRAGGVVMVPLVGLGLLLWFLIALRWQQLGLPAGKDLAPRVRAMLSASGEGQSSHRISPLSAFVREAWRSPARHRALFQREVARLQAWGGMIRTLYRAAPLLGLFGTVSGMIHTFGALTGGAQGGTMASGISQALVTTQMGLVVAIPAVVVARILDRRAARLRDEFARALRMVDAKREAAA